MTTETYTEKVTADTRTFKLEHNPITLESVQQNRNGKVTNLKASKSRQLVITSPAAKAGSTVTIVYTHADEETETKHQIDDQTTPST